MNGHKRNRIEVESEEMSNYLSKTDGKSFQKKKKTAILTKPDFLSFEKDNLLGILK